MISVCNSERIMKMGQYLRNLCSMKKDPVFLTHSVDQHYAERHTLRLRTAILGDKMGDITQRHSVNHCYESRSKICTITSFQLTLYLPKARGCRRVTAPCFVSLNISLSYSRPFEMKSLSSACVSLYVFHTVSEICSVK